MTNMTTLGEVLNTVEGMSKDYTDRLVNIKHISFEHLGQVRIKGESHSLKPIAKRAICNRLRIPHQYLNKCPLDLQSRNLNHWIEREKNSELFFRFDGDQVRAMFTPKYKPFDNLIILQRLESLGYGYSTTVQCNLDEEFMLLSILDGLKSFSVNGDRMTPGIAISNSEVGLSSFSIAASFLRLVCTNGLIAKTELSASYRHVSNKILEEFSGVMEKVSLEFGPQMAQFRLSVESRVDDPEGTIKNFNNQFGLGKMEQEAVEWGWSFEEGETMFHIINAYTKAAQFQDLPAALSYALQRVGGNILGMVREGGNHG